ncbi:MAG: glycosyltransferase family 4 protein [Clostridia bacterium]|nr:glycosyltransferase family 4 protein [Clostridia bacterium]
MLGHKRIPTREGGIEIVVKELSTRMVQRGKRVTVYNRHRKKEPVLHEYMGVRLIETGAINMKGIEAFTYSIIATLRAVCGKFEVIHFHAEGPCAMIWLPHLLRIPTVATIHGLDWQRAKWGGFASWYIHLGEYMAVRHADRIIVLSRNVQRYFMETYHRETEFIENGIASMPYREADLITKKLGVKKDDYLLFLGRIVPEKGLHYLIEAFGQIKTDKKLIIAGASGQTDEYFEEIKKLLSKDERVQLAGFVEGAFLEELYSNCCYYVLPSDVEGMAISLLEAMSYGCNCLVSDIEENTEVTGEYAYTFSKGNVADLKEKLEYMLLHEKEINMPQKKQEIRAYIEEKYSWDHVVNETFKLYEAIQKRRNNK